MSATIRKVLPTIAAVLFFVSTLSAAFWEITVDLEGSSEEFVDYLIIPADGEPGRRLDTLRCPQQMSRGERGAISASITNPGASAYYEITVWDWDMYQSRYSYSPGANLCSTTVHVRRGETAEVTCDITVPREGQPSLVVIWAVSSEDIGTHPLRPLPNSYFGVCQVHIGSRVPDYIPTLLGWIALIGVVVSAMLWLLTRKRDGKLVTLTTSLAAVLGILVWISPLWFEILRLESGILSLVPTLALIVWVLLFFTSILSQ